MSNDSLPPPVVRHASTLQRVLTLLGLGGSTKAHLVKASGVLVLVIGAGTLGYRWLEGWALMDGFYMSFITLTTIGFAEVRPLSTAGRLLTIAIGTVGIVAIGFIVTRTAEMLVSRESLQIRQMKRTIKELHNHYIVCGYGRIGSRLAYNLDVADKPFVVVEKNPNQIEELQSLGYLYVEGNAEEEGTLIEAGLERAYGLIAALSDDASNVFVTLTARELNPDLFIMSRAYSGHNVPKMERAGADKVVSPYELGADRMAQLAIRPRVYQFLEQALQVEGMDLSLEEIVIPSRSSLTGTTLRESGIRDRLGAIVVAAIRPDNDQIYFNPEADFVLEPGMTIIVLGPRSRLQQHELLQETLS